ncbi:sulfoquinovose isomerase [Aureibacillus halotolerans]|uniref:L-fucose isomerase-like protein n=1 Tax=Aureibacillus halotolerans TaxID=1508390 RepID=A0A4V3D5T3_9BACI|nr:hypothetical protein [Aureibacillus halotolerans]TDQ41217.1 L-fucose isomerase-like protein [Aureibacillus halotolerans]
MKATILYAPIGRKTFDMEAANAQYNASIAWLESTGEEILTPGGIMTSPEEVSEFLATVDTSSVYAVLYQSVTFADGEFVVRLLEGVDAPFVVWSVREPSVGGRLRLNSLTGGNSTSHVLHNHERPFRFVLGNPDEPELQNLLGRQLTVLRLRHKLQNSTIGVVGDHPPGFYFSEAKEEHLHQAFGMTLKNFDIQDAFDKCVDVPEEEWRPAVEHAERSVVGLDRDDHAVKRFAQFYTYMNKKVQDQQIAALAMRCWPDFFEQLQAAPCSTLSHFTDQGIVASCESDIHGSVSMYILRELTGTAPYLGDLVHVHPERNSTVFWHCGAGAYSLASPKTGATVGVHPNRKLGFALDFGLKSGIVTIFRVSYTRNGYRLLVMKGKALEDGITFQGTSVEVGFSSEVEGLVSSLMAEGYEPHYAIVYGDVTEELTELGEQLGIPTKFYE